MIRSYFIFESSKGRKDLVFISLDLDQCRLCGEKWHSFYGFTYTIYWSDPTEVIALDCADWRKRHFVSRY